MSNHLNFRKSQILFIFTPNGLAHVLSTIFEYFWLDTKKIDK